MMQEFVQEIQNTVQRGLRGIHTAMPGQIVSFDAAKGIATVKPAMKFKKPDGKTMDFPQVTGVPVVFPQGNAQGATVAFPIKPGDSCLLVVAEQSLDYWQYGQETSTDLAFDMTNAICIPGLFAQGNSVVADACAQNAVIVDVKGTRLTVKGGSVTISAPEVTVEGNLTVTGSLSYVPIVTDDPQDNVEAALNLVFIKDEEVYVRGYGPAPDFSDATLSNVTRDILQKYSPETLENVRLKDDLELSCATSEWLFDGIDTIEGVVALLYTMAWAFAETRERLRMYEETRLSPLDLKDRLIAPFQNDMFAMVWGAFKKLYPDKDCEIYWEPQIRDEEDGKPVYGLTDFADDGSVAVFVKPSLEVANAVEILAHELAHVAVGVEHDHDEVWQEAFDKIFEEYNRIGSQMFPNGEQCVMDDPDEK